MTLVEGKARSPARAGGGHPPTYRSLYLIQGYIEAQNRSVDGVRESIKKLLRVAEETKVAIALEKVWNKWCVRPELYNGVVASFNSPWVNTGTPTAARRSSHTR